MRRIDASFIASMSAMPHPLPQHFVQPRLLLAQILRCGIVVAHVPLAALVGEPEHWIGAEHALEAVLPLAGLAPSCPGAQSAGDVWWDLDHRAAAFLAAIAQEACWTRQPRL
jgi:hypothetical protein